MISTKKLVKIASTSNCCHRQFRCVFQCFLSNLFLLPLLLLNFFEEKKEARNNIKTKKVSNKGINNSNNNIIINSNININKNNKR